MIFKFICYDMKQGTLKHLKRFLLVVIVVVISCIIFDKRTEYITELYNEHWGFAEYSFDMFSGRFPFTFDRNSGDKFSLPLTWFLVYFFLAYCIGDYINTDMGGFGMQMMVRSKKSSIWWSSKFIWCILSTVLYFLFVYVSIIGYSWARYGDISNERHFFIFQTYYGGMFGNMTLNKMMFISVFLPVLAGIVQSLCQMVLTIVFDATKSLAVIAGILVIVCYYGNKFLPHGYAMTYRYYVESANSGVSPLSADFGIKYLIILCVILFVTGYFLLRRKDILENNI